MKQTQKKKFEIRDKNGYKVAILHHSSLHLCVNCERVVFCLAGAEDIKQKRLRRCLSPRKITYPKLLSLLHIVNPHLLQQAFRNNLRMPVYRCLEGEDRREGREKRERNVADKGLSLVSLFGWQQSLVLDASSVFHDLFFPFLLYSYIPLEFSCKGSLLTHIFFAFPLVNAIRKTYAYALHHE